MALSPEQVASDGKAEFLRKQADKLEKHFDKKLLKQYMGQGKISFDLPGGTYYFVMEEVMERFRKAGWNVSSFKGELTLNTYVVFEALHPGYRSS